MRVARLRGEQSVAELVRRLYRIEGPDAAARAEAALIEANPQLRDLRKVPLEMLIAVPEIAGIPPTDDAEPMEAPPGAAMEELRASLEGVRARLETASARSAQEAAEVLKLLKTRGLKAAARKDPAVVERLAEIDRTTKQRIKDDAVLKALQENAIEQLNLDLESLATLLRTTASTPKA